MTLDVRPLLLSVAGLPAVGKTTIARELARRLGSAYVRIDTIEATIARCEGSHGATNGWEAPPGYALGYELAADQLVVGTTVVVESVNPLRVTRDAWADTAARTGARLVDVEVVCSDAAEHRRRAESRELDVPGLTGPSWDEIVARTYEPWHRARVVVDTAVLDPSAAVDTVVADLGR